MSPKDAGVVPTDVARCARQLVASAGIDARGSVLELAFGTNSNVIVTAASGERVVYRRYVWPGDGPYAPLERMRREAWVFDRLGSPRVLAASEDPPALVLEFLPGVPLGVLAADGETTETQWRTAGASLAVLHELTAADATEGGVDIEPDDEARDLASVASTLESLSSNRPDLDLAAAWRVLEVAEQSPRRHGLIHGDAHLWNMLAGRTTALIDIEKSAGGDPDFDLAYFDGLRFADGIGEIPDAFYEGYGRRPAGAWYELHRVGIAATVVDVVAKGYTQLAWDLPRAELRLQTEPA